MNDYWNDPPEQPEPPSCPNTPFCKDGVGEYLYDGKTGYVFSCDKCAYQWVIPFDRDPEPEPDIDRMVDAMEEREQECPHGHIGSCDACDYLGDIAYDTERERRHFGK